MLRFDEVVVQFSGLTAINKLSFEVPEGMIYSLIGPNGAGKTTVFNCISRFYTPSAGRIEFNGRNILSLKPHQIISSGIARSFQNIELFGKMSVLDNVLTGMHSVTKSNIFSTALHLPSSRRMERQMREKAFEVMELLGIRHLAEEIVSDLPFGYQKMVDIGRAMITEPKLLLLDEPVAGMNPSETKKISELILRLKEEMNMTVLLIEHDMSMVMEVSDYITVVNFGEKIAEGVPKDIQNNQAVIKAYLGEAGSFAEAN